MMWKESYRIGIDRIDEQHRELFKQTEELLRAIEQNAEPAQFQRAISFLKEYVVHHFQDEEMYQARIGYERLDAHKLQHQEFTETVLAYEKLLIENEFNLPTVKRLAGTLSAWLTYHVAEADQRIVGGRQRTTNQLSSGNLAICCRESALDVLEKAANLIPRRMEVYVGEPVAREELLIHVGLSGDLKGSLILGCSAEFARGLTELLTSSKHDKADELVCSAILETASIIGETATASLAERGITCRIGVPKLLEQPPTHLMEGVLLTTKIGGLHMWMETI